MSFKNISLIKVVHTLLYLLHRLSLADMAIAVDKTKQMNLHHSQNRQGQFAEHYAALQIHVTSSFVDTLMFDQNVTRINGFTRLEDVMAVHVHCIIFLS